MPPLPTSKQTRPQHRLAKKPISPQKSLTPLLCGSLIMIRCTIFKDMTALFSAFTLAILGVSLLQWLRNRRTHRFADLSVWIACLALHWPHQPISALLATNIAVGHLVWISLPGSFASPGLPNHMEFMLSLNSRQHDAEEKDCMICWDDSSPLADLPCGHHA